MASFPDLRPGRRSAKAESKAARRFRSPVLLAVSAALLLTAFLAVSELATLHGAKAHDASAFLTRELGSPLSSATLVRKPAHGVTVTVRKDGYRVTRNGNAVSLTSSVAGDAWQSYEHGARRSTSAGHETILIRGDSAEEFLTVSHHQGQRTWRWRLDTKLQPRVTPQGFVGFFSGSRLTALGIDPVAILDGRGREVTPAGARWSIARHGKNTWLELALDDRALDVPYTIDPTIAFRAAGTVAGSPSGTTINVTVPAGAVAQDLLLLQVDVASTTIPSTPANWTLVASTNTFNTNVAQAVFWKKVAAGDIGNPVSVTIPNAAAVGVVTAYKGVNTAAPIQQTQVSGTANNRNVTCPAITTNAANEMVLCAGTIAVNGTWPASGGGYTRRATGAQGTSVSLGWYDQFVATSGTAIAAATFSNVAGSNTRSIANTFGLAVDTGAPNNGTISITGISPAGIAYLSGGTIFYRGSVAGQFQIRDPFTDTASAPDHVHYPATSGGWTHAVEDSFTSPNFTSANYSWTAGTTTPPSAAERTITEYDAAGNTATQVVPIVNDTTAPQNQTVTLTGANAPYYKTNSVSWTLGDGDDGSGSGLDTTTRTVTRETATLSGDSCGSFSADGGTFSSPDATVSSGHCYRYTFTIKDNVGNVSTGVTATAKVDGGAPTHGTIAISGVSPAGIAYLSGGGTIFYRGSAAGQFKISDPATDSETAVASVNYPLVSSAGWTHANESPTTGPNFTSSDYLWSAGTTTPPTAAERTLTATDKATNTSTFAVPIVNDTTAPGSQTITLTGANPPYYTSASVSFTLGDGSDGGSGLDASTRTVTRETGTLSGDSCSSFSADGGTFTSPDTAVSGGHCYRYTFTIKDNVGNVSTGVTATAKVDTTAPTASVTAPTEQTGSGNQYYEGATKTQWFRSTGSGSFTLNANAADGETGIAGVAFPNISALSGWSGSTGGNDPSSPYSSPVDYAWTAGASEPGSRTITATNNASATGTDSISIKDDTTAPTAQSISLTGTSAAPNYYKTNSVSFSLGDGSDGSGSGLDTSSRTVTRETATLSNDGCGPFSADGGTFTSPDTTVSGGHCYRYTFTIKDNVGNVSAGVTVIAKVDTVNPTVGVSAPTEQTGTGNQYYDAPSRTQFFRPAGSGSFTLNATASDTHTAVAQVAFPDVSGVSGWSGSTGGTDASSPYASPVDYTWTAGASAPDAQTLTATDKATNNGTDTVTIKADSSAPSGQSISLTGPNPPYFTSASVSFSLGDGADPAGGSGLDTSSRTVTRESATLSNDSCGSFSADGGTFTSPDTAVSGGHCYRYTFTIKDNVGNVSTAVTATAKVDTTGPSAPTFSFSSLTNTYALGSTVFYQPGAANGAFTVTGSSNDGETGIQSWTFPAAATGWTRNVSGADATYSHTGSPTDPVEPNNVHATNNAGTVGADSSFTVTPDSTAPTTTIQCNGAPCLNGTYYTSSPVTATLSADDAPGSGVQKIRYTTDGTDPTLVNGTDYMAALSINTTTTVKFRSYDNLGNTEAVGSQTILLDGTPPTLSLTLTENPASGAQHVSGTTVFYRPGAGGGTFRVTATADDPQTGVSSVLFPSISNVTGGSTQTSPPFREDYTWSASTTDAGSHNVVATNGASATTSVPFTLTQDAAAPTGQSLTLAGANAPYYGSASVSFTLGDGSDSGSGLDTSTRTVTRESATLSGDSCGSFSADPGTFTSPDTAVSNAHCYRYSFTIADNVGNVSSAVSTTAKVDTANPSVAATAPSELTGTGNQYYNTASKTQFFRSTGSGSFDLNATASDTETAVTGVSFPNLSALTGWTGAGGSDPSSPYSSPTSYSWSAGAAEPGARTISATDKAANTASDTITLKDDSSAPTGQALTLTGPNAPYYSSASVSFSLTDGSDGTGSGLDTTTRTVTRETATLSGDSCGSFSADPGTFTSPDTAVSGGHCYRYTFTITDRVGNTSAPVTATAKVDTDNPAVSLTDPGTPLAGTVSLAVTASDPSTAVQQAVFERAPAGGSTWTTIGTDTTAPYTASWDTTAVSDGLYDLRAVGTDKAGNSNTSLVASRRVDNTAPNTTIDSSPSNPSGNATPTFTFSSSEPGSSFECRVDGGSWSSCTSPHTLAALIEGSHTFDVRATDAGGNTDPTPATYTWTLDLTAPNTTIDSSPSNPSGNATPTFTFSSSEPGSSFECRLDGGSWSSCTSPDTISPALSEGSHTFDVRATDAVGNTDASPATYTWTVDLTAPNTTIDSSPSNPSGNATPTFTFSSSEPGSSFECRVDGGSWSSCTSPHTLAALTEGSHTFDVRATDPAGHTDASPATYTWTVDLTAPNTTIDSSPSNPSGNATPTFSFSSSEPGSTFECRVDAGSWSSCTSPDTISPALAEGSHTFDVRAIDSGGNTDATPASYTWVIDLGVPTVTITAPTSYINGADPNNYPVTAATPDTDVARVDFFECSNASIGCATGSWTQFGTDNTAPYSATWSTPAFDGPKAIRAVVVDLANNTGQHVRTITIDRTAPSGVTVSYPNGYVTGSFAITTGNGPDGDVNASTGTLERRTGDLANDSCSSYGSWAGASSPDTVASGKCAQYRYRVADNAGNWATATSSNEAKSDTDAPTSSQADPGANLRQTITLSASASDTGGSGLASVAFERRPAGGGSWTTIGTDPTSPYSLSFDTTTVADGLYDFRSVATDVAGNAETAPVLVSSRRIDNTPPSATMLSPGDPVRGTVGLTSNTSDGGSGIASVAYELAPHNGGFNSQPASWDTTLSPDGQYDLRVTATDAAGNSTTSALIVTRVDNTPPAVTFSSPATGSIVSGTVALTASASDASPVSPAVTFAYKLSSDPPSAYTATGASWNTTTLPAGDGLYDLRARATDDAGNLTSVENTSIRVDNAPPTISITAPPAAINGSVPSPTPFSASAGDPGGSGVAQVQFFECSNQSNDCSSGVWSPLGTVVAPGPYSVNWNIPGTDGNHALAAVATDNAGHPASAIRNVDVDRSAPNTTIVSKPADPSSDVTPTFTFTSSEPGSTFECSVDGGSFAPCTSPHNVPGLTDNSHTFAVRATDPAGNTDPTPDTWTWHRDTNAPTGTLNNPGANIRQTVTLTSSENDAPANGYASGLASVAYEYSADGTTWASIGTLTSLPFDTILWNTTAVADGVYQLHIVVRDIAGNVTTSTAVPNVRIDNTPPTTSQDDPGQYLRATKTLTASAADSGSGIDHVDFQRSPTGAGSWTTIGTDSTPGDGLQVNFDTTSVADGHYDFRTVAYDVAGNQASAIPVNNRLIDNTPPTATITNPGPYLRGAVNLTSTTDDPGGSNASGVVNVAYEFSTNGGTSWQSTGATFDSTSVPDGNVSLHVVATDAAGNTATSAAVTSLVDNTKPATTDNAPAGWQSSTVTVTLSPSDAGSGVNVTEYSVDGNPSYTVGTTVVIPAPGDGSNDGAHTIAYFSVDNAGNIETVKSATVLIDATPPTCPACSAADYLRGTVTLSANPTEGGSGIQSVTFEYTTAGGSTWTTIGTDTTGPAPYTADWNTVPVADGHYDLRIEVTDNAGNVTTTDLPDKVVDNTAPDVATVGAPTEGQLVTGTVAINAAASDQTSPVASVQFFVRGASLGTDTTAPFSLNWDTTTGADGAATIQIIVADMAGNMTTSAIRNVSVDNVTPTPTLADPGQYLNGIVALSASSDPDTVQVDFERRPAGGGSWVTIASDTTTPWGTSLDTTALSDGLYDFRVVATDQTGHAGASPIRSNARVDNTAPAGSITTPANGATVGGPSVALGGSYSDAGSGVASVGYELRPTGGGSWTVIATSTSAPFGATWDATTVPSGSYDLRPVITDRAANTFTGATITVTVDVTAPTVVLSNPGATIAGAVTLDATVTGSGATQVVFASSPAGGASWTTIATDTSSPWSAAFDTTKLTDGLYDLRATVSDTLGNTSSDVVAGIRIDNTAPRAVSSTPAEGSTVSAASAIGLVTSESATPVGVTLDGNATVVPVISGTSITYGTGPLGTGPHMLAGELQDSSGKRTPFRVHFTVWAGSGSLAPYVEKNTSATASTTVDSADGFAAATMPTGGWSNPGADWIVIRIAPMAAPSGLANGFGPGPEALDVTARWALGGTEVHQFSQPVGILIRSTEKGLVPATFENGSWRVLFRVPTPGTLPTGWSDGFYTDAAGFHVLTKHLSAFALLHDLEAPQPPQNVHGFLGPNGLTIRWLPGNDNSGTYDYVTVYSDSTDTGHYGVDYTAAAMGNWAAGDPRVFRLKETDLAGNESSLTRPLLPVPSLVGLTTDQAAAALSSHGFTMGQVTIGGEGQAGTVTGPVGLVLAEQGGTIDVTVAGGSSPTRFVFKVHTAPKFKPAARKAIAARVTVTRAARVTAELLSPRGGKLYTWRFSVKAGRSIVKLRLPREVRRIGVYTLRWTARAGSDKVSSRIRIRLIGTRQSAALKATEPIEVVLAGHATRAVTAKLPTRRPKVVSAPGVEPTFDAAASRSSDVRVIVVDVDEFGVSFIRDLHTVFPSVRIVALSASPRKLAGALRAGAVAVLPRSAPPALLAKVIRQLLPPSKGK